MKKSILVICLLFISIAVFSQKWTSFGVNLGYQGNKFLNANLKKDNAINTQFKFNTGVGVSLGINTNEFFQISFDLGYAKVKNSLLFLDYDTVFNFKGERKISMNTFNLGITFKGFTQAGYYLEAGAKYNFIASAIDQEETTLFNVEATKNIKNYFSLLGGIGVLAFKTYRTNVLIGFRGELSVTDLISDYGKDIYYPTYKNYNNNDKYRYLSGMIIVNLTYDIGILNDSRQTYRYSYFRD